mgnify:CR=1 FL=1
MTELKGSKTEDNLKAAFAGESQANRRYLYFAMMADVEGFPEVAGNFRQTAEGETGHVPQSHVKSPGGDFEMGLAAGRNHCGRMLATLGQ